MTDARWNQARYAASVLFEHLLLAMSFFFMIPAIPSNDDERYYFGPMLPWMLVCLCGSRYLALRRREESWTGLILKAVLFTAAGFVIYERVFG